MLPDLSPRERLGAAQAELMRALSGVGPVPADFPRAAVLEEARTLASKRRRSVAKARPALARALGDRFHAYFDDFAQSFPKLAETHFDAATFARWFVAKLADESVIECIHWEVGLRAVVAAARDGRGQLSREAKADQDELHALLGEIRRHRGPGAMAEPRLRAALVVASLVALGVGPERFDGSALRCELSAAVAAVDPPASPVTRLDVALATLRANHAIERVLSRRLEDADRERYQTYTGDDPFFDQAVPRLILKEAGLFALGEQLAAHWMQVCALNSPSAAAAARDTARRLAVDIGAAPPLPPLLARREALLSRAVRVLIAQKRAEQALATHAGLTPAERARVSARVGSSVMQIVSNGVTEGGEP